MTPETAIKKSIRDYLRLSGWFVFHVLQGLGAYKGVSDFVAIKDGNVLFIEVKTERGRQSEHQKKFENNICNSGGHYFVARDVSDVDRYIVENFGEVSLLL